MRKYAFGDLSVPREETQYLKIKYPAGYPALSEVRGVVWCRVVSRVDQDDGTHGGLVVYRESVWASPVVVVVGICCEGEGGEKATERRREETQ